MRMADTHESTTTASRSDYRERAPVAALRRHVACVWTQRIEPGKRPMIHRIVPDGCIDIVWLDGFLHVAGPDTGPVLAPISAGSLVVGIRFRPGLAPTMLGLPASELLDGRTALLHLWGGASGRLAERLVASSDPGAAMAVLERELLERLPDAAPVDRLAEGVVAELRAAPPSPVVAGLAATLGSSERQLHRRCLDAFGYGPKMLDRVLRFQRFLALARTATPRGEAGLARLAADAGYADQAHLARECRALGGLTPTELLSGRQAPVWESLPAASP
jgi:AraC-like DNA-binding protein